MSRLTFAGASDLGRMRDENQDRWVADPEQGLFLVADGMGGSGDGKLAADIVAEVLPPLIRQRLAGETSVAGSIAQRTIVDTLTEVSERLWIGSRPRFGASAPGSTVALALIRQWTAIIAHLGDSRAYLLHGRRLRQLTRDQSLLQALLESGSITTAEAREHPARSRLTQFMGMPGKPSPAIHTVPLAAHDRLLLCTDGLYASVDRECLEAILTQRMPASAICRELIAAALRAGAEDNVTAVVIRFES